MLTATDLTLWRGSRPLLDNLSVRVEPGQALLVRGPNGSGKTTLLRVLVGLTRPETGRVEWDGVPIESDRRTFGSALAWSGHSPGLKADLSVREQLEFADRLSARAGAPFEDIVAALRLGAQLDLEVRYLSAGQQRRAALARLLMSGAALWVIDEPLTNLDADGRRFLENRLGAHLEGGGLAVVATHHDLAPGDAAITELHMGAG